MKLDNYTIQTYFASLCASYGVIYDEIERLIREPYPNEVSLESLKSATYWGKIASMKLNEIFNFMNVIVENNSKIIITSYYEIIVLLKFYKRNKISEFDIINMDDSFKNIFPKDEISQRFRSAYKNRSQDLIYSIALEIY